MDDPVTRARTLLASCGVEQATTLRRLAGPEG
jgi:hypothetical protein